VGSTGGFGGGIIPQCGGSVGVYDEQCRKLLQFWHATSFLCFSSIRIMHSVITVNRKTTFCLVCELSFASTSIIHNQSKLPNFQTICPTLDQPERNNDNSTHQGFCFIPRHPSIPQHIHSETHCYTLHCQIKL
jgi:hypothetical protein